MTARLEALARRLPEDVAALVAAPQHLCYLTGFPSGESWIFLTAEAAYFLTDFRYIELARQTVSGAECRRITRLADELNTLIGKHGVRTVLVESNHTSVAELRQLREQLRPVTVSDGSELDGWLAELRAVKTPGEIEKIRQAQALTEAGFEHILPYIREGATEREVALELEWYIRRQGAQRAAFDFIVVSGANGSLPHGIPSDKPIQRGEFITMDFGAVVDGYHSDMTRTVALGAVSDEQRAVYETVLRAQTAALAVLRDGLSCVEGDAAARHLIEQAGYGAYFGHSTGHGVGVEIHEEPRLSPNAGTAALRAGQVVTVEPGIYLPGRFGVRIEDMAVITADGCEDLTSAPKELICL